MKTNEYVSDRGERFCVLPPKAGDPIRGAPSPSSPEIIYDMRVTVKGIEKNLKALCAAHKKIGWTLDNFEDDLQVIRRVIDTATSDENAARRAALLLQKAVDELANNTSVSRGCPSSWHVVRLQSPQANCSGSSRHHFLRCPVLRACSVSNCPVYRPKRPSVQARSRMRRTAPRPSQRQPSLPESPR